MKLISGCAINRLPRLGFHPIISMKAAAVSRLNVPARENRAIRLGGLTSVKNVTQYEL